MKKKALLSAPKLTEEKSLKTLVENRSIFSLNNCELNIFETYQESKEVGLCFNDFVVTSMLRGKKIMHLYDNPGFEYLPGETVIVPKNVEMKIDFPEANQSNPTQCIALAIDNHIISETVNFFNEKYPKYGSNNFWKLDYNNYFFYNNLDLANTINKLINVCMGTDITKDILANLSLQELLVRIIQTQTSMEYENNTIETHHNLFPIIKFIKENIKENFTIKLLSEKACISSVSLYRYFKRELGVSPLEFILNEKIKFAKKLLQNPSININEVSYQTGFEDCNYFIRIFKKYEGVTPKQYQLMNLNH